VGVYDWVVSGRASLYGTALGFPELKTFGIFEQ
jgi:hypothetical protein